MKTIGVLIADVHEYNPFCKWATENGAKTFTENGMNMLEGELFGVKLVAMMTNIGKVNAAIAATNLILKYGVEEIYNIGFSGAVKGVRRGDLVAGTSCTECDFDLTPLGLELGVKPDQKYVYETDAELVEQCKSLGIKVGALGTGDIFLTSSEKKADFHNRFGIVAFDMESGAIASVCDRYGIKSLSIRKISDDSEETACEDYREMNKSEEMGLTDTLISLLKVRFNG